MRKSIIESGGQDAATPSDTWLDLERLARVEITSEDPRYPIEAAFAPDRSPGWRAGGPGLQIIRLVFDQPHYLGRASLYAVLNPLAAGLCDDPAAYTWSSYRETAGIIPSEGLLDTTLLFRTLDDDIDRARAIYRELVAQAVVRLRKKRTDEEWWKSVAASIAHTGDRLKSATSPSR